MKKIGVTGNPLRLRVQDEGRLQEIAAICGKNNWKFICGLEPDYPEDICELEYMLNPKAFRGEKPKMKQIKTTTFVKSEPGIQRNEPCPCGSGKKYKNCCLNKEMNR